MLIDDIILYICTFLHDTDINNYLSVTKKMLELKHKIKFNDPHKLTTKINKLNYYDSFTNLIVHDENYYMSGYLNMTYGRASTIFEYFLPKNLIKINFKTLVPKLISNLTCKEIHITVDSPYELKLIKDLKITSLIINFCYDRTKNTIPESVKYLKFKGSHVYEIQSGDIPSTVTKLKILQYCRRLLPGSLPSSITKLSICGNFDFKDGTIPSSVIFLRTNNLSPDDYVPSSVTHCKIDRINDIKKISASTITHLTFSKRYTGYPLKIPLNITHLTFKYPFNRSLENKLSPNLTHLILPLSFNQDMIGIIPSGLKFLTVRKKYNTILNQLYPELNITYI